MSIIFTQQKRSQKILIIASVLIIIITLITFWQFFLRKEDPHIPAETPYFPAEEVLPPVRKIEIDFDILKKIRQFHLFIEIQPFQEIIIIDENEVEEVKIGRENPFIPF